MHTASQVPKAEAYVLRNLSAQARPYPCKAGKLVPALWGQSKRPAVPKTDNLTGGC